MDERKIITVLLVVLIAIAGIQTFQLLQMSGAFTFEEASSTSGYIATTTAGQADYSTPAPSMVGGC